MDRDIEDTRQPKEPSPYSACDRCEEIYDTDDLVHIKPNDDWLCKDCYEEIGEAEDD